MGLFASLCLFALMGTLLCDPDYYWRPYSGLIPDDALVGRSISGFNAYIGRTSVEKGVFIGELQGGINSLNIYAWNDLYTATEHIEILCSGHPENFEWVLVNSVNVYDIPVKDRVIGGFSSMYNGSHTVAKELLDLPVGWAATHDNSAGGAGYLCYAFNQTEAECAMEYYALTYHDTTILNETEAVEVK